MSQSTYNNRQIAVAPLRKMVLVRQMVLAAAGLAMMLGGNTLASAAEPWMDYRILATSRTSTMEKELNEAAASGYRFSKVMGGKTAIGGKEVVIAMVKNPASADQAVPRYKLLATTRTSTMQRELQQCADAGYEYLGQTIFETAVGGKEVVVIMEQTAGRAASATLYRLLATSKTSSMEKELNEAGKECFLLVGFNLGKTAIGGEEIVSILRRN